MTNAKSIVFKNQSINVLSMNIFFPPGLRQSWVMKAIVFSFVFKPLGPTEQLHDCWDPGEYDRPGPCFSSHPDEIFSFFFF